jgi:hypothetical protein
MRFRYSSAAKFLCAAWQAQTAATLLLCHTPYGYCKTKGIKYRNLCKKHLGKRKKPGCAGRAYVSDDYSGADEKRQLELSGICTSNLSYEDLAAPEV